MKKNAAPELSASWWKANAPKTLEKARTLETALTDYERAQGALKSGGDDASHDSVLGSIDALEKAIDGALKEAKRKAAKWISWKIDKQDYQYTIAALEKFPKRIQEARRAADSLRADNENEEDGGDVLGSAENHAAYLKKTLPRMKKMPLNFALGLGGKPDEHRFLFHRSKTGQAMGQGIKRDAGLRKITWGVASALEAKPRTLALMLEGKQLPAMAKKGKALLKSFPGLAFNNVVLLVEGEIVDDLPDEDDRVEAEPNLADLDSIGEESADGDPDFLAGSWKKMKAALIPRIKETTGKTDTHKAEIARRLGEALAAEKEGRLADAMAILRDRIVPLLKAARRDLADGQSLRVAKLEGESADATDGRSASLQGVLDSLGEGAGDEGEGDEGEFDPSSFFTEIDVGRADAGAREWAINLAALRHFAAGLEDGPAKKALLARSVGYMAKFANIPNADKLDWQSSPLQASQPGGIYHRAGGTNLYEGLRDEVAATMGLPPENVFLASDPRIMEAVQRDFQSHGSGTEFRTWDEDQFTAIINAAAMQRPVFLDVTRLYKSKGQEAVDGSVDGPVGGAAAGVADLVPAVVLQQLLAECYRMAGERHGFEGLTAKMLRKPEVAAGMSADERAELAAKKVKIEKMAKALAKRVTSHVTVGATVNVGGQTALCVHELDTAGGAADKKISTGAHDHFQHIMGNSGFTVGPNQLIEQWLDGTPNIESLLKKMGVGELPAVTFPADAKLATFADLEKDFLTNEKVSGFAALASSEAAGSKPYLKVMPKVAVKLIEGLAREGVPAKMVELGLGQLYQLSMNRIASFMEQATAAKDDFSKFLNFQHLIMAEVSTLLAVAQPHEAEAFGEELAAVTSMLPDDFPKKLAPKFSLKNSATRCFASVLTGLEDMKERKIGKRGLNVSVQGDSYYEPSLFVLTNAKDHKQYAYNTDEGSVGGEGEEDEIKERKLDCYLCEFHHNIAYDRQSYKPEDVTAQVRKLIDDEMAANPFTVIIDTTIAKTDAPELKDFLDAFKDEIGDGRLNVVIYRSAQKFDQMGMDAYNGGIMARINNGGEDLAAFNESFDSDRDAFSNQNVQGMTHYNKYAQEELNEYRDAIMANAAKLGSPDSVSPVRFPAEMLLREENKDKAMLQLAVNEDEAAPFLDIKFPLFKPDSDDAGAAYGMLIKEVIGRRIASDPDNFTASTRASFGFPHSNFTLIGNAKMRFNPGLEDDERLARLRDFFVDINTVLMEAKNDLDDMGMEEKERNYILSRECMRDEVIKVIAEVGRKDPGARSLADHLNLAKAWIRARNPKAATRALSEASAQLAGASARDTQTFGRLKDEATQLLSALAPQ